MAHLDALVDPDKMEDYGPNGLQVEGREAIKRIAGGVTASRAVIKQAIEAKADALLVHHGLFWAHMGPPRLTGWLGERVRLLIKNDVNLIVYHLPLDVHPELGNNARLLDSLGLKTQGRFGKDDIGAIGESSEAVPAERVVQDLQGLLGTRVIHIPGGDTNVKRIGVVTGAGQRYLEEAIDAGCDLFITGEASEFVTHVAREAGIHYVWAGHHATERSGVQALFGHLEDKFAVETLFADEENPV